MGDRSLRGAGDLLPALVLWVGLATGSCGNASPEVAVSGPSAACPSMVGSQMVSLVSNDFAIMALRSDGRAFCRGVDLSGYCGDQYPGGSEIPIGPIRSIAVECATQVSIGGSVGAAVTIDGKIAMWGSAEDNEYADGTLGDSSIGKSKYISGLPRMKSISVLGYPIGVDAEGGAWWWDDFGWRGGVGGDIFADKPTHVVLPSAAEQATFVVFDQCFLLKNGDVYCRGADNDGQLGDGKASASLEPVKVSLPEAAIEINAGLGPNDAFDGACAVLESHRVACWGEYAALAGVHGGSATPVVIGELDAVDHIRLGEGGLCAFKVGGYVSCLGGEFANYEKQANGLIVLPFASVRDVAMTDQDGGGCVLTTDNELYCIGEYSDADNLNTGDPHKFLKVEDPWNSDP